MKDQKRSTKEVLSAGITVLGSTGSVRAAFVGLPGRLGHQGPPWLLIHPEGGLSSPECTGEEEAAQDSPWGFVTP